MKSLFFIIIPLSTPFLGCQSKKQQVDTSTILGNWYAETTDLHSEDEASPQSHPLLMTITETEIQVYDIDAKVAAFDGRKRPYQAETEHLSLVSQSDLSLSATLLQGDNNELKFANIVTSPELIKSKEIKFSRIGYSKSQGLFKKYLANLLNSSNQSNYHRSSIDEAAALTSKKLDGYWMLASVAVGDKFYIPGQLIPENGERVPEGDFFFYFKDGKMLELNRDPNSENEIKEFDIAGPYLSTRESDRYSNTKLHFNRFSEDENYFLIDRYTSYVGEHELFMKVEDELATKILKNHSTYLKNFDVEPIVKKDMLEGFWLFTGYIYKDKKYDITDLTDDGKSITPTQVIFHVENGKIRQYFGNSSGFSDYLDFKINGSLLTIPTQKPDARSIFNEKSAKFLSNINHSSLGTSYFTLDNFVSPSFVEGEFYEKLENSEAEELLRYNSAYQTHKNSQNQ